MTEVVLIDIQMSIVTLIGSTFEEIFQNLLEFTAKSHDISILPYVYPEIKRKLKKLYENETNSELIWSSIIYEYFGPNLTISISEIVKNWIDSKPENIKIIIDPHFKPFCLKILERFYQVRFFVPTKDKVEKEFYECLLHHIIPNSKVFNYLDSELSELIKNTANEELFIVSARPRKLKEKMLSFEKINSVFNFRTNFIFFRNYNLYNETILYYDEQLIELGISWDIFNLKFLASRLLIMRKIRSKEIDSSDLVLVQIYNSPEYINKGVNLNLFYEGYPVIYSFAHPLSKRKPRFRKVVGYIKWGYLSTVYKKGSCESALKFLFAQKFTHSFPAEIMPIEQTIFYSNRKQMQFLLNSIASVKIMGERLRMLFPTARILPIKTLATESRNFTEVFLSDTSIDNIRGSGVSTDNKKSRYKQH